MDASGVGTLFENSGNRPKEVILYLRAGLR